MVFPMQQRERELEIERRKQEEKDALRGGGQGWKAGPAQANRESQSSGDNWNSRKSFQRENGGQSLNGHEAQEASKSEDTPNERSAANMKKHLELTLIVFIYPSHVFLVLS